MFGYNQNGHIYDVGITTDDIGDIVGIRLGKSCLQEVGSEENEDHPVVAKGEKWRGGHC